MQTRYMPADERRAVTVEAVVALANKNARILWALMTKGDRFDVRHASVRPNAAAVAA